MLQRFRLGFYGFIGFQHFRDEVFRFIAWGVERILFRIQPSGYSG